MDIIFKKKKKKEIGLILISVILVLILITMTWWGFFKEGLLTPNKKTPYIAEKAKKEIKINFEVLRLPILEKFKLFSEIKPFEQEIGKGNPFIIFGDIIPEEAILEDITSEQF